MELADDKVASPRHFCSGPSDFGMSRGQSLHNITASHYQGPDGQALNMVCVCVCVCVWGGGG